jgi:hypothetical protein
MYKVSHRPRQRKEIRGIKGSVLSVRIRDLAQVDACNGHSSAYDVRTSHDSRSYAYVPRCFGSLSPRLVSLQVTNCPRQKDFWTFDTVISALVMECLRFLFRNDISSVKQFSL